jgi:hypothetical protein
MAAGTSVEYLWVLNENERGDLLEVLQQALVDARGEARRTEAPGYQKNVHERERRLQSLVEKMRKSPVQAAVCKC